MGIPSLVLFYSHPKIACWDQLLVTYGNTTQMRCLLTIACDELRHKLPRQISKYSDKGTGKK
jgi:hypothetical protein